MESQQTLNDNAGIPKVKYIVGKLMREHPEFRTHKTRLKLVNHILNNYPYIKCSMESITRAQRKLWEIALDQLRVGNYDYAFNFLPNDEAEFKEWIDIRKESEIYKKYYARGKGEI